ncbi:hypothetical protein CBM2585_B110016 [Cupriavidus taiwanensis]|nr:hypothetical protein CBM2585_B110016 [Cupriavidus taiwanensis]
MASALVRRRLHVDKTVTTRAPNR